jgi:uncharacterized surface anchored protein
MVAGAKVMPEIGSDEDGKITIDLLDRGEYRFSETS